MTVKSQNLNYIITLMVMMVIHLTSSVCETMISCSYQFHFPTEAAIFCGSIHGPLWKTECGPFTDILSTKLPKDERLNLHVWSFQAALLIITRLFIIDYSAIPENIHTLLWTTLNWVLTNFRISKGYSSRFCRIPYLVDSKSWGIPEFCKAFK